MFVNGKKCSNESLISVRAVVVFISDLSNLYDIPSLTSFYVIEERQQTSFSINLQADIDFKFMKSTKKRTSRN